MKNFFPGRFTTALPPVIIGLITIAAVAKSGWVQQLSGTQASYLFWLAFFCLLTGLATVGIKDRAVAFYGGAAIVVGVGILLLAHGQMLVTMGRDAAYTAFVWAGIAIMASAAIAASIALWMRPK